MSRATLGLNRRFVPRTTRASDRRFEFPSRTAHHFEPSHVVGFYLWRSEEANTTYLRVAFCGEADPMADVEALDEGIVAVHWLSRSELLSRQRQLRSPMVLRCLDDYVAGHRYPLDIIRYLDPARCFRSAKPRTPERFGAAC